MFSELVVARSKVTERSKTSDAPHAQDRGIWADYSNPTKERKGSLKSYRSFGCTSVPSIVGRLKSGDNELRYGGTRPGWCGGAGIAGETEAFAFEFKRCLRRAKVQDMTTAFLQLYQGSLVPQAQQRSDLTPDDLALWTMSLGMLRAWVPKRLGWKSGALP